MSSLSDLVLPPDHKPKEAAPMIDRTMSIDLFKWIVTGLLGALFAAVGWFLGGIQAELREVRKEVAGVRIDTAVATTRLENLIAEFRRHDPR